MGGQLTVLIERGGRTRQIDIDLEADIGEIDIGEGQLMIDYLRRAGITDQVRAWAGAHILVKLARQAPDIPRDELLEAVIGP